MAGRESSDFATDTLPVSIPGNAFYSAIDPGIRQLVKLLRDNGINTTCSCEHDSEIQFDVEQDGDVMAIHRLLSCNGYKGYRIETNFGFPPDGFPYHRGRLLLNEWM